MRFFRYRLIILLKFFSIFRFLLPLNLSPEAQSMPEIMTLYKQYEMVMEDFKESHKNYEQAVKEGTQTRELRSDSVAIENEIENVKKRLEKTQTRLDKIQQPELILEAAKSLRIEKDRHNELQMQIEEQKQGLQRANVFNERLSNEYQNSRMASQGTTSQQLLESIIEETQVLEFMVKQKLPQEILIRQTEVQILKEVIEEPSITREYLSELQYKIDEVNKEVQRLVEAKMNERGQSALAPFRQQASLIARNKESAAEQLDLLTKELKDVDYQLKEKQQKLHETVGELILRGDDLKSFVNTLRAKSNVYKQQRAELAGVRAEVTDLQQTLDGLKAQDPSLSSLINTDDEVSSLDHMSIFSRPESPLESRGITELSRLVDGLTRAGKLDLNLIIKPKKKIPTFFQSDVSQRVSITTVK